MKTCSTCNKIVSNDFVEFKCPKCGKHTIIRCLDCKKSARGYECEACKFMGP